MKLLDGPSWGDSSEYALETAERRRSARYPTMLAARVYDTASGKDYCSLARRISAGGCELLHSDPLGPGETILLELVVGVTPVRVVGKVVAKYTQAEDVFVSCVKFIMLNEDAVNCLQTYIGKMELAGNQ